MRKNYIFSSESVTAGHPDKLCDQISDAILDAILLQDPSSRVMAETALFGGVIFLSVRLSTTAKIDIADTARRVAKEAGYRNSEFNADESSVMISNLGLLPECFPAVDIDALNARELGQITARNQVTVFGFASHQTESLMPLPIILASRLTQRLEQEVKNGGLQYLMPDGKSQVAVEYKGRTPVRVHGIGLIACQNSDSTVSLKRLRDDLVQAVIEPVMSDFEMRLDDKTDFYLNPEGPFLGGGPKLHSGLTGRKTAIDTYGEYARHSGSALSGKDPLRVDRSGAYAARYAAKHVVAAGLAEDCEVQLTYTVGQAKPISIQVDTFNTGNIPDQDIEARIRKHFDLRPGIIVRDLGLQHLPAEVGGFYRQLAAYGHMGREDLDAPWERLDKVDLLKD